jgi:competence protein ComEC
MEELKVDKVVISMQGSNSENYSKFVKIVKERNIKVVVVGKGDRIKIENDLYFDVLWPNNSDLITENVLNNNSIVCKMNYRNFSMLFTGDIEEIAEKQILNLYKNNLKIFNSTILKVAHHGSKTSSIQNFVDAIKPKIALIGVGENNKFGHPNEEVIKRLETLRLQNIQNR